jgi:hypothetical protein
VSQVWHTVTESGDRNVIRGGVPDDGEKAEVTVAVTGEGGDERRLELYLGGLEQKLGYGDLAEALVLASEHRCMLLLSVTPSRRFGWTFTHVAGPFQLSRITARFLGVDHHSMVLPAQSSEGALAGEDPERDRSERPAVTQLVDVVEPLDAAAARRLIVATFGSEALGFGKARPRGRGDARSSKMAVIAGVHDQWARELRKDAATRYQGEHIDATRAQEAELHRRVDAALERWREEYDRGVVEDTLSRLRVGTITLEQAAVIFRRHRFRADPGRVKTFGEVDVTDDGDVELFRADFDHVSAARVWGELTSAEYGVLLDAAMESLRREMPDD